MENLILREEENPILIRLRVRERLSMRYTSSLCILPFRIVHSDLMPLKVLMFDVPMMKRQER